MRVGVYPAGNRAIRYSAQCRRGRWCSLTREEVVAALERQKCSSNATTTAQESTGEGRPRRARSPRRRPQRTRPGQSRAHNAVLSFADAGPHQMPKFTQRLHHRRRGTLDMSSHSVARSFRIQNGIFLLISRMVHDRKIFTATRELNKRGLVYTS